jgi:hypothetical protein
MDRSVVDQFHHRLSRLEDTVRRSQTAPTIPKYDLQINTTTWKYFLFPISQPATAIPANIGVSPDTWHTIQWHIVATLSGGSYIWTIDYKIDGISYGTDTRTSNGRPKKLSIGPYSGASDSVPPGYHIYFDNVKIGTSWGASDLFVDDFESGNLSLWDATFGTVSVISMGGTDVLDALYDANDDSSVVKNLATFHADVYTSCDYYIPSASYAAAEFDGGIGFLFEWLDEFNTIGFELGIVTV